jgi:hypothetical protein
VCIRTPNVLGTYLTDEDETTPDGSILCQNLNQIETTARHAYELVRAAKWIKDNFPRVP